MPGPKIYVRVFYSENKNSTGTARCTRADLRSKPSASISSCPPPYEGTLIQRRAMQKIRNKEGVPAGQKLLTLLASSSRTVGLFRTATSKSLSFILSCVFAEVMGKVIMVEVESSDYRHQEDKD